MQHAALALEEAGMQTAQSELREAVSDLSRRPKPDLSGAVHHAMAALECVAREVSEDPKRGLGDIVKKYPNLFPKPLDDVVAKAWGYSSETARHAREGRVLDRGEAELIVGISVTLCAYVAGKAPGSGCGESRST